MMPKHIDYRDNSLRSKSDNVAHQVMSSLFRTSAKHQVFSDREALQHMTLGQVKSLNDKGKHLFYRNDDGVLQAVDIEGGSIVLRILYMHEILYVERNGIK